MEDFLLRNPSYIAFCPPTTSIIYVCNPDSMIVMFSGMRVDAFLKGDEHHDDELENGNGTESEEDAYREKTSLYLIGEILN